MLRMSMNILFTIHLDFREQLLIVIYSQVHNKWGVKLNGRFFKDFDKLLNGVVKINGGWKQNIKEKRRK